MTLTERHIIRPSHAAYAALDNLCYLSKNLYNSALYRVRQHFFDHKKYLPYGRVQKMMQDENQKDYRALKAKVAQSTIKNVDQNFRSFFALLKVKKKEDKVRIPQYLDTTPFMGRYVVTYTAQAISSVMLKQGMIQLSGLPEYRFKTNQKSVRQVRLIPKGNHIVLEVLYEKAVKPLKQDNGRYAAIDMGLNNLCAVGSNVAAPFIINGKPLKSVNQFYNKTKAYLQSRLPQGKHFSKALRTLTYKRNNKVNDYLHKASREIVNQLVFNDIHTVVIGKNKEWKQDINIGKRNNQNFVNIPHARLISLIAYKCELEGIHCIVQEESYTSKCSFLDDEEVRKHEKYLGRRVKRGLFRASDGRRINADVNGSMNILKKAVGKFDYDPIEVCSTPCVVSL